MITLRCLHCGYVQQRETGYVLCNKCGLTGFEPVKLKSDNIFVLLKDIPGYSKGTIIYQDGLHYSCDWKPFLTDHLHPVSDFLDHLISEVNRFEMFDLWFKKLTGLETIEEVKEIFNKEEQSFHGDFSKSLIRDMVSKVHWLKRHGTLVNCTCGVSFRDEEDETFSLHIDEEIEKVRFKNLSLNDLKTYFVHCCVKYEIGTSTLLDILSRFNNESPR